MIKCQENLKPSIEAIKKGLELRLIVESKEGNFLGTVSVHDLNSSILSVGIWFRKEYWGKGFGFEAMNALIEWVQINYKYNYIEYRGNVKNLATLSIAQKCGGFLYNKNPDLL